MYPTATTSESVMSNVPVSITDLHVTQVSDRFLIRTKNSFYKVTCLSSPDCTVSMSGGSFGLEEQRFEIYDRIIRLNAPIVYFKQGRREGGTASVKGIYKISGWSDAKIQKLQASLLRSE